MSDVGHVGWSPDYRRDLEKAQKRAKALGPGIGGIECHSCSTPLLVLAGEPPKDWKWSAEGWLCPECVVSNQESSRD